MGRGRLEKKSSPGSLHFYTLKNKGFFVITLSQLVWFDLQVKTSSLPNYGTPRQNTGFRTPSLPRRLGVKMGTRAIYSTVVQRDSDLTDDLESLSVKSDTASSMQSASVHSNDSPMPEAYVLSKYLALEKLIPS